MKIIITEDQYNMILESNGSNVVEQIMDSDGIKLKGFHYGGRTYDNFRRQRDMVHLFFTDPMDPDYTHMKTIVFLTKNNKVFDVYTSSDFRPLSDAFRYIPTDVLMSYFFEKAKTYLEGVLSNDSLKESVIKEDTLKSELKQMIKSDGWESTYPLIGDAETLAQFAFDNDPMKFIDLLITKKRKGKYSDFFGDDNDRLFLQFTPDMEVVELNFELSEFLLLGFKLDKDGARNVIKDWLFDRYGIEIKDVSKIYL